MKTKQLDPVEGELAKLRWLVKTLRFALYDQHVMLENGVSIEDDAHKSQCNVCSLLDHALDVETPQPIDPIVDTHFRVISRIGSHVTWLRELAYAFQKTGNGFMFYQLSRTALQIEVEVQNLSKTFTDTYCITEPKYDVACPVNDLSCEGGDDQSHDACQGGNDVTAKS